MNRRILRGNLRFCVLVLALATTGVLRAQQVGVGGAGELGGAVGSFPIFSEFIDCGEGDFNGGGVGGYRFGIRYLQPMFNAFNLRFDVDYASEATTFTAQGNPFVSVVDGELANVDRAFRFRAATQSVDLSMMVVVPDLGGAVGRLDFFVGGWGALSFKTELSQIDSVLNGFRLNDSTSFVMLEDERGTFTERPWWIGLAAGLGYRLPLGGHFTFQPEIAFRWSMLSPVTERGWQSFGGTVGATVLFDLAPSDAAHVIADNPSPPEPVKPPPSVAPPVAAIELSGLDAGNNPTPVLEVPLYTTFERMQVRIPRWVEFEHNSATLPREVSQLTAEEARRFHPDSLEQMGTPDVLANILNVIGYRLSRTDRKFTLGGYAAAGEPNWLAYGRLESVRRYLESVWKIDPNRIEVRHSDAQLPGGAPEHRQLVVISGYDELLEPLRIARLAEDFDPPLLNMMPDFSAEGGVRDWKILLRHDTTLIGSYTRRQSERNEQMPISWHIGNEDIGRSSTLSAELIVEDSLGATTTARSALPLEIRYQLNISDRIIDPATGRETLTLTLYPATGNDPGATRRNQAALAEFARRANPEASVSIDTDSPEQATELADALRTYLSQPATSVRLNLRDDIDLTYLDAELPENRTVSSGARLRIEQAVEARK